MDNAIIILNTIPFIVLRMGPKLLSHCLGLRGLKIGLAESRLVLTSIQVITYSQKLILVWNQSTFDFLCMFCNMPWFLFKRVHSQDIMIFLSSEVFTAVCSEILH